MGPNHPAPSPIAVLPTLPELREPDAAYRCSRALPLVGEELAPPSAGATAGLTGAVVIVALASALALASEDLPRFFFDLGQWYLLAPTFAVGVTLQLAAWVAWSALAWLLGRIQGSTAGLRATLAATGTGYVPALIQALALAISPKEPAGVTAVALIKVIAAGLVAVTVAASLARTQQLSWPRAALSGIGWLLIALLVMAGYSQQVSMFGTFP